MVSLYTRAVSKAIPRKMAERLFPGELWRIPFLRGMDHWIGFFAGSPALRGYAGGVFAILRTTHSR